MYNHISDNSDIEATISFSAVATEPRVSSIPTFYTNEPRVLTEFASPSQYKRSLPTLKTISTFETLTVSRKDSKSKTLPLKSLCDCPHIIVADDDPFQHVYYRGLLQKALKAEGICIESQDLCLHACSSGEELIKKMNKILKCGCHTTKLMILDYQMGEKNLNGVETSVKVRKDGYDGNLLLRTSETKDSLKKNHQNFELLLKDHVINVLVNKNDMTFGENFIQKLVTAEKRAL